MATTYKVLGQIEPEATTLSTLYTVPASTQTVVSSLTICNRTALSASYRVAIRPAGASILAQHYLAFDAPIAQNDTIILTVGITLNATDVISVYSSNGDIAFHAYGSEIA
jgi:hypothetical protein